MALHSFCGILTLQVGVALLAGIFWTIAFLTFVVNFFDFFIKRQDMVCTIAISGFVIGLLMSGLIAFFSAYNENQKLCMAGVALVCLLLVGWITMSCISFYNEPTSLRKVCVRSERCPESFWLAPLRYRNLPGSNLVGNATTEHYAYEEYGPTTTRRSHHRNKRMPNKESSTFSILNNRESKISTKIVQNLETSNPRLNDDFEDDADNPEPAPRQKSSYVFSFALIGAVVLFLCNLLFFLFAILVLWSYGQELTWTDRYLQTEPGYTNT